MSKNYRDDPTVQMIRKAQANDLRPRSTSQTSPEVDVPRLRATIDELDEAAATVVFTVSPMPAVGPRVDVTANMGFFPGMPLLAPGGAKIGTITSVAREGASVVCTADLDNRGVVADIASGEFNAVEVTCQTLTRRSDSGAAAGSVRPLSIRLVATTSTVNADMNASKSFYVRRADGRSTKKAFTVKPHAGTGAGSGLNSQLGAFKKIHAGGGTPLSAESLLKLANPGKSLPAEIRLDDVGREMRKIQRNGKRPIYK